LIQHRNIKRIFEAINFTQEQFAKVMLRLEWHVASVILTCRVNYKPLVLIKFLFFKLRTRCFPSGNYCSYKWQAEKLSLHTYMRHFECHFYHVMLCVSAVLAVNRCPSVRPSRWCIVSKRLNISSNCSLHLVAPSFEFLESNRCYPVPRDPLSGDAMYTGVGKICDF